MDYSDSQAATLQDEPRDFKPSTFDMSIRRDQSQVWYAYHVAMLNDVPFSPIFVN